MSEPSGTLETVTGRVLAWGCLDTPVGRLSVACSAAGVTKLRYGDAPADAPRRAAKPGRAERTLLGVALAELAEYFGGQLKSFSVPVDLSGTSGVRRAVLSVLHESVGFGETITYGGLAQRAGLAEGTLTGGGQVLPARVVGQVMASNPCAIIVPCHRVVAGSGLGGYSGGTGTDVKQWLLIFEGAIPATLDWDASGVHRAGAGQR
jgi:methylated-DNA-[protein]-cysteine S-methyltransferase